MPFPNLDVTPDPIAGRWSLGIDFDLEAIVSHGAWNGLEVDGVPWGKAVAAWLDAYTDSIIGRAFLHTLNGTCHEWAAEITGEYPPFPIPDGCVLEDLAGMVSTFIRGGVTGGASAVIAAARPEAPTSDPPPAEG